MDTKALFKIGYGLYVLTANADGFDNGCIINSVMQAADRPVKLVFSVNKQNKTHDMIVETGLVDKVKVGKSNYYFNTKLIDLFLNHNSTETNSVESIESVSDTE